jgi:epoxyqueuosine reductase
VPEGAGWTLDSRRCISYLTIELRGPIPEEHRAGVGEHVFGCDICQDVCPWNSKAPVTADAAFRAENISLEELGNLSPEDFRHRFRASPLSRAKYAGMLRNAAVAMANAGVERYAGVLATLAKHPDAVVREHAEWALRQPGQVSAPNGSESPPPIPPKASPHSR